MISSDVAKVLKSKSVWVSSLGYFVDVYDLVLFGIVRVASLGAIGISDADRFSAGALLLNWQMAGMLLGGFAWGILGDRYGRTRALYGSIFLYSVTTLANAFVTNLPCYVALRFLSGFGLAGELGAAVTLVSESVPKTARSIGAVVIGFAGFLGAASAATLGGLVTWQTSYLIGGGLGLLLLVARIRVGESKLFLQAKQAAGKRQAGFTLLLKSPARLWRFARCILVGIPIWFVSGILVYFSPEFGKELGVSAPVVAGQAIFWNYMGSILGDPLGGLFSQLLKSRKRGILAFLVFGAITIPGYFVLLRGVSVETFYFFCFVLGIANAYWTLFVAMTAEQFGTEMRATVTTSAPNLVRAAVIPMTTLFLAVRGSLGPLMAALAIGLAAVALAIASLISLPETFGRDLDYLEAGV